MCSRWTITHTVSCPNFRYFVFVEYPTYNQKRNSKPRYDCSEFSKWTISLEKRTQVVRVVVLGSLESCLQSLGYWTTGPPVFLLVHKIGRTESKGFVSEGWRLLCVTENNPERTVIKRGTTTMIDLLEVSVWTWETQSLLFLRIVFSRSSCKVEILKLAL